MYDCRVLRGYRSFCLGSVFLVAGGICRPCRALDADTLPLDNPIAVIRALLPAVRAIELPAAGRGIAIVKTENFDRTVDGKEVMVHFAFNGDRSREDYFEYDGKYRGPRLRAVARSGKTCIRVGSEVYITDPQGYGSHEIGQDFRPETFLRVFRTASLAGWLEYQLDHQFDYPTANTERSVRLDDKGVLHVSVRTQGTPRTRDDRAEVERTVKISFDTRKGYRPVYYERRSMRANGSEFTRQAKLQWARFGSVWYVLAFEANATTDRPRRVTGTIKEFRPDVSLSDAAFTLDGLDILEGTTVRDDTLGKEYLYESPENFPADPEIPDKEADIVRRIRERQSATADAGEEDGDKEAANVFYLRVYQTGRLIGPLSLTHGTLLPPLDKETYIVVNPTKSELEIRQRLLDSFGYESAYSDCEAGEVIGLIEKMMKHRLGEDAPDVRIEDIDALISMRVGADESAYEALFRIAAKVNARVFIEDGTVILSRKGVTELTNSEVTTSDTDTATRRGLPSR